MIQRIIEFLKNFKEKHINGTSLTLCGIIFIVLCLATCKNQEKNRLINQKNREIAFYKDINGNQHAVIQELTLGKQEMREKVDSISRILKIKPKQVVKYVSAGLKIDTVPGPEHIVERPYPVPGKDGRIDTVKAFTYVDTPHIYIDATPDSFHIQVNAKLAITNYWKRNKVLGLKIGAKQEFVDITTSNPYIQITEASSYKLQPPHKLQVKVGVGVTGGINLFTKKPAVVGGVGIFITKN